MTLSVGIRRALPALLAAVTVVACSQLVGVEPSAALPAVPDASVVDAAAPAPSCAASLDVDAKNCGRCGHDCLGGECVDGTCRPFAVAQFDFPLGFAPQLAVGVGGVALLSLVFRGRANLDNQVVRWTARGGVERVGPDLPAFSAIDETHVYAWRCALRDASNPPQYGCDLTRRLLFTDGDVEVLGPRVLITPDRSTIESVMPLLSRVGGRTMFAFPHPKLRPDDIGPGTFEFAGAEVVRRWPTAVSILGATEDGWLASVETEGERSLARFRPCASGTCSDRLTALQGTWGVPTVVVDDQVFFADGDPTALRYISVPLGGGPQRELARLARGSGVVKIFALSPRGLFFSSRSQILWVPPTGGTPELLAETPGAVQAMGEGGGLLYWVADGALWRLPL